MVMVYTQMHRHEHRQCMNANLEGVESRDKKEAFYSYQEHVETLFDLSNETDVHELHFERKQIIRTIYLPS